MDMRQLTFLVVEDHEFQRNMVVKMLRSLKAKQVYSAADGREGLELLKSLAAPVDIVISDLDMPSMDGLEFIRHLGRGGYSTSLIVASALDRSLLMSVENMANAYAIDFLGTIEKPVTPRKLEEMIQLHQPLSERAGHKVKASLVYGADEIVEALYNDEFEPFFQPKIDLKTGEVVGAEALARWNHPNDGILPPAVFVRPLEESGKVDALMRCMLTKSARFCREHRGEHQHHIAINLSVLSLGTVEVADQITEIVRRQHVDPHCIVLEVTESAAMTDIAVVLENLARLRMKGFGLAIDDYGTGYSSLEQLSRIPFSELKIDQGFVTHAGRKDSTKVILESSLEMARRLGIRAVAEGVETRTNWDLLVELKCDVAQGYYISKPLSGSAYIEWLHAWEQMRAPATVSPTQARGGCSRFQPIV